MKIGILTFHRTANDGSVLQNWCLQQVLRSLAPGNSVETIDLRDGKREQQEYRRLLSRKPPFVQVSSVRKMIGLRRFIKDEVAISSRSLTTNSLDAARAFVLEQGYGAVVSGSDTVWQLAKIGDTPPPHLYFQPGFSGAKKIAFAVSADPVADTQVLSDPAKRAAVLAAVVDFDFIGVRDETTRQVLLQMGVAPDRIDFMPDPTVLQDFSKLVRMPAHRANGKVAGVALQSRALTEAVSALLQQQGWQVVNHLGATPEGASSVPGNESMGDRLGRFATQDLLVSDRFHSSIFTLKLGQAPVVFVESAKKWPEPTSKGRDLLTRLGCADFVWRPGHDPKAELKTLLEAVEAWRASPPDMTARFQAVRDSGQPALRKLAAILQSA